LEIHDDGDDEDENKQCEQDRLKLSISGKLGMLLFQQGRLVEGKKFITRNGYLYHLSR